MLELIVVLAIIAATVAVMVPRLQGTLSSQGLQLTAEQLAATLRSARAESQRRMRAVTVILDPVARVFQVESHPVTAQIDPEIGVEVVKDGFEWMGRARRIRFLPDGTATGGIIRLSRGRVQVLIAVDWLTGAVSLSRGATQ